MTTLAKLSVFPRLRFQNASKCSTHLPGKPKLLKYPCRFSATKQRCAPAYISSRVTSLPLIPFTTYYNSTLNAS